MFRITFVLLLIKIVWGQSCNYLHPPNVEDHHVYEDVTRTYRLPNNTRPESYQLNLRTWIHEENFTFNGKVVILILVTEASNKIVLHQRQLEIENLELRSLDGAVVPTSFEYDPILEFLVVNIDVGQLSDETKYILEIDYNGILRTDKVGFYRSSYVNDDGNRVWLATTQFKSTNARHGFPCFDEPALKARFSISITHDPSFSAISNMPVNKQDTNIDGSMTTHFEETPPISTYLIAYIVSDFEYLEKADDGNIPQRTYARSNAIHLTEFALNIGVDMLAGLAEYIGINYSLPTMYQAAIPDFGAPCGASEGWGLVTYNEPGFFYNESESTISTQVGIVGIIGHDLAHQWFGNLVSPKWWSYVWLNEGFANLVGNIGVHILYPDWNNHEYFVATTRLNILKFDALSFSHPMTHYIETPSAIDAMFNTIAYQKGALVLRMFSEALSSETFIKGIRYYLEARAYSYASEEDLFEGLQRAATEDNTILPINTNIEILMSSWTRQAGFPIVTSTRDYNIPGNVTFNQRRFMSVPSTLENSVYWVPLFIGLPSDPSPYIVSQPIYWLSNEEQNHQIIGLTNDDWFIVNKYAYGFYRVMYDRLNYRLITNALIEDHFQFATVDRAMLIDDLYVFAESELIPYDVFFDFLQYLRVEYYYEPWYVATQAVTALLRRFDGQTNDGMLRGFIRSLVEVYYEYVGIEDSGNEHRLKKYSRNIAISLACYVGSLNCRFDTTMALRTIIETDAEFHQNVRNVLYCAALRGGDRNDYDAVWNRMLASNDQTYRDMLISALGCTSSNELLMEFLNSSLNSTNVRGVEYRSGEQLNVFNTVYQSGSEGLLMAINFLLAHLIEAEQTFGIHNIPNIVIGFAERITLYSQRNQFSFLLHEAIARNYIDITVVEESLHIMSTRELWFFKHENLISSWLLRNHIKE